VSDAKPEQKNVLDLIKRLTVTVDVGRCPGCSAPTRIIAVVPKAEAVEGFKGFVMCMKCSVAFREGIALRRTIAELLASGEHLEVEYDSDQP